MTCISPASRFAAALVLGVSCSVAFINGFQWANYTTVPKESDAVFSMTNEQLNILLLVYTAIWVPCIAPSAAVQQRYGPVNTLRVAVVTNFVGCVVKLLALWFAPRFWCCLIGQTIAGAAEVFFLGLPPLIASAWFAERWRGVATALSSLANSLGIALAFAITAPTVQGASDPQAGFQIILVGQAVVSLVIVVCGLMLPSAPAVAPSTTAQKTLPLREMVPAFKALLCDRSFLCLNVSASVATMVIWTVDGMYTQALAPFGVSEVDAGVMGSLFTLLGAGGQLVAGRIVDRTRDPYPLMVATFSLTLAILSAGTGLIAVGVNATAVGYVVIPLMGLLFLSGLPAQYDFVAELTYGHPLAAAMAIFSMTPRAIFGPPVNQIGSHILGNHPGKSDGLWFLFTMNAFILGSTILLVVGVQNRRARLLAENGYLPETEEWVATGLPEHLVTNDGEDKHHQDDSPSAESLRTQPEAAPLVQ